MTTERQKEAEVRYLAFKKKEDEDCERIWQAGIAKRKEDAMKYIYEVMDKEEKKKQNDAIDNFVALCHSRGLHEECKCHCHVIKKELPLLDDMKNKEYDFERGLHPKFRLGI